MSELPVLYEKGDGVALLTINRPQASNALNAEARRLIGEYARKFEADPEAKVLILTGTGDRSFCAGADLKEMADEGTRIPPIDFIPQFGRTLRLSKPTIAAVNGHALAGGFLLAQNCDLVVAAEHASFGITEIRWSRGAPWAIPLVSQVGPRAAMEILLTGDPISAARAFEIGFVNHVVPGPELLDAAVALAARIGHHPPLAVRAARQTVELASRYLRDEAFERAEEVWSVVYNSRDAQEGPRAFRERRAPAWEGH
jgi:enoyl-CoA hydratase/carnithine racemase